MFGGVVVGSVGSLVFIELAENELVQASPSSGIREETSIYGEIDNLLMNQKVESLKLTASLHLNDGGWETIRLPFGVRDEMSVLGSVGYHH